GLVREFIDHDDILPTIAVYVTEGQSARPAGRLGGVDRENPIRLEAIIAIFPHPKNSCLGLVENAHRPRIQVADGYVLEAIVVDISDRHEEGMCPGPCTEVRGRAVR